MISPEAVAARLVEVRRRLVAAGGREVAIVAVTKGFGADAIDAAVGAGLHDIGESYAQETLAKLPDVAVMPDRLHFVGRLQRNKVRRLVPAVAVWQSVDRVEVGHEIARRAPGAAVMVQVDISGEATKGGCAPGEVDRLVDALRGEGLDVTGLMGVGPLGPPEDARPGFAALRAMVDRLGLRECSMGMSGDLEVAVAEGATMVRIGTDLFGPRPARR